MNSIMWSQGLNETDDSFVLIDSVLTRYSQTVEQKQALSLLFSDKFKTIADNKKYPNASPSFKLKKMKGWTYVEGNFNEKDDSDRIRVYIFACKSHSIDRVIFSLLDNSRQLGCTPIQEDINIIKKSRTLQIIKSILIVLIITLCLTILTIVISLQ